MATLERFFGARWRIRRGSAIPAHVQIEEQVAERIASRELAVGERLPAERELARSLDVSRMTVRQALSSLAARGLVERGVGRGTFVAARKLDHDLTRVTGFTDWLDRHGLEPDSRVLEKKELEASWAIAAALEITPRARVARIRRLRLGGGVPLVLEDAWLPADAFPRLTEHDLDGSLYAIIRDAYGREPARAIERLEPATARAYEAKTLGLVTGAPLMRVERTVYDRDGVPLEFARERHRGDRARWIVRVSSDVLSGSDDGA